MSHFAIVLSAVSTAIGLLVAVLGFVVRATVKWTRVEDKLGQITTDLRAIVENKEKDHVALYEQMKEDRRATNDRLTYLERSVWPTQRG